MRCGYCGAPGQFTKCDYCQTLLIAGAPSEKQHAPTSPNEVTIEDWFTIEEAILRAVQRREERTFTVAVNPKEMANLLLCLGSKVVYEVYKEREGVRMLTGRGRILVTIDEEQWPGLMTLQ